MNNIDSKPTISQKSLAASFTAITELVLLGHVCDRIKTFQQSRPEVSSIFKASQLIRGQEGLKGFYSGLRWNMISHGTKAILRWNLVSYFENFYQKRTSNSFLASSLVGCSVGTAETFLLICPAESIKTKEMTKKSKDFRIGQFIKQRGLARIYDGWDSILFRQVVSWSSFLLAYDITKKTAYQITGKDNLNALEQFTVGATAGLINVACIMPIDTIKTQLQKQDPITGKHLITAFRKFYQTYGIKKFYSGGKIRAIRSTWHAGITLFVMENLGIFASHKI